MATQNGNDERKKARASARRAAKRGYSLDGPMAECALCGHRAHSLVSHIKQVHGMDAGQFEEAAGIPLGTATLVSPALAARLAEAGKRGADALAAKRAVA